MLGRDKQDIVCCSADFKASDIKGLSVNLPPGFEEMNFPEGTCADISEGKIVSAEFAPVRLISLCQVSVLALV